MKVLSEVISIFSVFEWHEMNSAVKALKKQWFELQLLNEPGSSNSASEMFKTRKQQKFISLFAFASSGSYQPNAGNKWVHLNTALQLFQREIQSSFH